MQSVLGGSESRANPSRWSNAAWIVASRKPRKRRPLVCAILTGAVLPLTATAAMAVITVDAVSSATSGPNTAASSLTFPHTVHAGSNPVLLVSVHTRSGAVTVNSVMYGSANLTQVGSVT